MIISHPFIILTLFMKKLEDILTSSSPVTDNIIKQVLAVRKLLTTQLTLGTLLVSDQSTNFREEMIIDVKITV